MVIFIAVGAVLAILNLILTYNELMPFFKAVTRLNDYTRRYPSIKNQFLYAFRFMSLVPKLSPLVLDGAIAVVCGMIGLGGGVMGALVGITLGFTASLMVKVHRHWIAPKLKEPEVMTWKLDEEHV